MAVLTTEILRTILVAVSINVNVSAEEWLLRAGIRELGQQTVLAIVAGPAKPSRERGCDAFTCPARPWRWWRRRRRRRRRRRSTAPAYHAGQARRHSRLLNPAPNEQNKIY
eukprot:854416-Pleurochrysis_carterae.AAC.5